MNARITDCLRQRQRLLTSVRCTSAVVDDHRRTELRLGSAPHAAGGRQAAITHWLLLTAVVCFAGKSWAAQAGNPLRPQMASQPIVTPSPSAKLPTHPIAKPKTQSEVNDAAQVAPLATDDKAGSHVADKTSKNDKAGNADSTKSNDLGNDSSNDTSTSESSDVLPAVAEPPKSLTLERIAELAKNAREATIADELKADLATRYQNAVESLQGVDEAQRKIAQYEQEMVDSADRVERARQALATAPAETPAASYCDKSLRELETLLEEAKGRLASANSKLAEREAELKNRSERKADLVKKLEETRQRQTQLEQELQLAPAQGEAAELTVARRTELEARQVFLRVQVELYQSETRRSDKLAELFPLQRDLAKRESSLIEKEVSALGALVDQTRQIESERQAVEARRQANLADPAIRGLAERNAELAERRHVIAEKISQSTAELQNISQQLGQLNTDFQRAQDKVKKAGHTATVGLMLRHHHESLPSLRASTQRLRRIEQETPVISLEQLEIQDERTALGDIDAVREQIMAAFDAGMDPIRLEEIRVTVNEMLSSKRDMLDSLHNELDAYLSSLSEVEANNRDLINHADDFRAFIDEHVLWIRSDNPFRLSDVRRAGLAVHSLSDRHSWVSLIRTSGIETLRQPLMATFVVGAVSLLLGFRSKLRQRIRMLCQSRVNSLGWTFLPAIRALLLTAVVAAQGPLVVWYIGWRMNSLESVSELGAAVGPALRYAALLTWFSSFLRSICRQDGVAETFFDWPRSSLRLARQSLRWLTWIGVPLASMVLITQQYNQAEWADSLGRLSFALMMIVLIVFTRKTLGSQSNVFREEIAKDPQGWLNQIRFAAYAIGVLVPVFLLVLTAIGYYYSAQQLAIRLQATLIMSFSVLLVHAIISRWFVVKRKRLALRQTRERQQQQSMAENTGDGAPPSIPTAIKEETDWAAVHERLRLLLRHAVTVGVLIGSWFIWSDVLPALRILDRVELWTKVTELTESYVGPEGTIVKSSRMEVEPTTLRHGLLAVVSLFAALVLGKNLPALLEITLLNRLPLDRGGRHAVCTVLHYGVALAGLLFAFRTLHINWGSVQWLAAGMTVGLGFGLQEIFANFVSGMILLFERPIRVGDVVTLDTVSGVVTDIRIRATTITDWDRKELIVPNKDLVTGRLLNWTLSDTTNRIVIRVGLAYDTDAQKARDILYETISRHPNVLADPAPAVVLESFGESTLDFVVRAYLATLDVRLETVHQLHVSVHQQLRKAGIEFAFPQRDLNIRHLNWPAEMTVPVSTVLTSSNAETAGNAGSTQAGGVSRTQRFSDAA